MTLQQIKDELLDGRDLSKKGNRKRQLEYAERTTITADFVPRIFRSASVTFVDRLKGLADLADRPRYFKVQVVVQCATRIEARPARRTYGLTIQVLTDGQLSAACAAQHRLLIELSLGPNPGGMMCFQFVTVSRTIKDVRPINI